MNSGERVRLDFVGQKNFRDAVEPDQRRGAVAGGLSGGLRIKCGGWHMFLVEPNAIVGVPRARIGKDDLVAGVEAAHDFDRVDGAFAELHRCAQRFAAAGDELEHADGIVFLPECRAADEYDVIEALQLDRAVDAEIGTRAFRQRLVKCNIDSDRALLDRGIDSSGVAFHDAITCVDRGLLVWLNVFRLRLGDLDLCF